MPDEIPIFGERLPGEEYVLRPSVYALLPNARGELAVVRVPQGWFLPGGGIEPGESDAEALIREVREECGLTMRPGACIGRAMQLAHALTQELYYEKPCGFLTGELDTARIPPIELDHELHWLAPEEAARVMLHESHQWAVRRWMSRVTPSHPPAGSPPRQSAPFPRAAD